MRILRAIDNALVKVEYVSLVLFFSIMVVLAFVQVVLRNFFATGILWGDTVVRHLVIWVGFTGAAIATHQERHISIDALTKFLSDRWKAVVQISTNTFAIIVCYYLADASVTFLLEEKAAADILVLSIPTWVVLLIIPAGYALMAVHFAVKLVESAVKAFSDLTHTA